MRAPSAAQARTKPARSARGTPAAQRKVMNVGERIEEFASSVSTLVELHIKLARLEATDDLKRLLRPALVIACVLPVALLATAVLLVAAVVALHRVWPLDLSLLTVGLGSALLSVAAMGAGLRALKSLRPMDASAAQLEKTLTLAKAPLIGQGAHGSR